MADGSPPEAKRPRLDVGEEGEAPLAEPLREACDGGGGGVVDASAPAADAHADADAARRADAGGAGPSAPPPAALTDAEKRFERENWLARQEADGDLRFLVIQNDGEEQHLIWLVDLKNIYAKQLPNMPKEYIVRLVFDRGHKSLIALKNGVIVGGITYRLFARQHLGEIAFCAVSAVEQVKGYGTRLMDKLKGYASKEEGLTHMITFADNNAVGYFQKQGFSKEILMEREKWAGYIKEYDGGTLMECILLAKVPADFPRVIRLQREAVEARVRELTNSHVVHPGLAAFQEGAPGAALRPGGIRTPVPFSEIEGLKAAGWTPAPMRFRLVHPNCGAGVPTRENLHRFMRAIHASVTEHADSWPFMEPVDPVEVPDYCEVVKEPIDLQMILNRIDAGDYYITLEIFAADFRRLFNNCRHYNAPDTPYFKCANRLESFFETKVAGGISWTKRSGVPTDPGR